MKLALATPLYPPEGGGPATYAKALEDELPKYGWEVETVKFRDVRHLPKIVRHIAYGWRVFRAARRADLVLALDPVSTGLPAHIAAHLSRKPFFVRIAGDYAWEQGAQRWGVTDVLDDFVKRKHYPLAVRFLKRLEAHVAEGAHRIIVPSKYLKRIVSAWGVAPDAIAVVYNAAPESARAADESPLAKPYVVSIARLVPWKGMDTVIRAAARVEGATLVIVGDGPERAKLEGIVRNLELADRVIFTGNLPHEETMRYLSHAAAFILNTRYEGLSHLILEALALGVPVLTTPAGGNIELIEHEKTGLLFPYGDVALMQEAIERIGKDEALRAAVTQAGAELVKDFTKERMITDSIQALSL